MALHFYGSYRKTFLWKLYTFSKRVSILSHGLILLRLYVPFCVILDLVYTFSKRVSILSHGLILLWKLYEFQRYSIEALHLFKESEYPLTWPYVPSMLFYVPSIVILWDLYT